MKHLPPELLASSFTCPHCHAIAHQYWFDLMGKTSRADTALERAKTKIELRAETVNQPSWGKRPVVGVRLSRCYSCSELAVWVGQRLVHPPVEFSFTPHADMPSDVRADFVEAGTIAQLSPRGAGALLRLAFEKLVNHLLGEKININLGIQKLVDAGMPKHMQEACDFMRITGNEYVHPGSVDLRDDTATVTRMAKLLNLIVENTISFKREMAEIYPTLPADKLQGVEDRLRGGAKKVAQAAPAAARVKPAPAAES